ncbi:hypothetical protein Ntsu_22520 [Nocardia sp. IFM 10818]
MKIRTITLIAASSLSFLAFGLPATAEAIPEGCRSFEYYNPDGGGAFCTQGSGWVRVVIRCYDQSDRPYEDYGNWVKVGETSSRNCGYGDWIDDAWGEKFE